MVIIENRISTGDQLPLKYNSQMMFDTRKVVVKKEREREREGEKFFWIMFNFVICFSKVW